MSEEFNPFAAGEILRLCPTTAPQREILASARLGDEANTAFNEAISVRLEGPLDADLLSKCIDVVVERHELLRASFARNGREVCLQSMLRPRLQLEDWTSLAHEQQAERLDELWKNIAVSPMNLEEGPLFFAWLLQLGPQTWELVLAAHHIICDGWSFGLLLDELVKLYASQADPGGLPPAQSFFEFAARNDLGKSLEADIRYWREQVHPRPPVLDLPLDFVRPKQRTFAAKRYDFHLSANVVAQLPAAAAKMRASLVQTVLAGYFVLLHRLTRVEDIVVGLPVAGQAATGRTQQLGHMVQLLPIRARLDESTPFCEVVARVKERVLSASEHPNSTFGELIEGMEIDRSRVPLISTIFNIDQPIAELDLGACKGHVRTVPRAAENFEIFLNVVPRPRELVIETTYATTLFSEASVVSWLNALEHILAQAIENPELRVGDIALCRQLNEHQITANQTRTDVKYADVVHGFRARAQATPDAVAVLSSEVALSYRQLDERSDALAASLSQRGVREESVIAICCERSERMLIAALAVLKLGATYLPLDPDFPSERLTYMLQDAGATAVLEDDAAPRGVREAPVQHVHLKLLDELSPVSERPLLPPAPGRRAYLIYTSGSTGKPKGVAVPHRAMINFVESMVREPGCRSDDCLLAVTTLSFDISVLELFVPLLAGARVVIATRAQAKDGELLCKLIERHQVTLLQATPATWRLLLASNWASSVPNKPLRALCGGEPLPPDLVGELLPRVAELWNMFGPTETTVWSTCKHITSTTEVITVGKPIANTQVYLLDHALHLLPAAIPGELCIGGVGVALGYHQRPELTAERFLDLPGLGRIYRTGDLAKQLPNGEIQHLGRLDDQAKLRGYRIELGEIESALKGCDSVQSAAAYLWELSPSDVRLVACCVPATGGELDTSAIRKRLRESLPAYMIPQYLLPVPSIALTPNGKVDRRALPRPEVGEAKILSKAELRGPTEELIAGVWTTLLKPRGAIGRDDNFFELGGHSLLALEAIRQIDKLSGARLTLGQLVSQRLSALAEMLGQADREPTSDGPISLSSTEARRLSPEQMRILRRQQAYPGTICNNLPAGWIIRGDLDVELFSRSLQRLMERQTALRTVVHESDGSYRQTLIHHRELADKLPEVIDCRDQSEPLQWAMNDMNRLAAQPFPVLNHLLFRARLYRLAAREHVFFVVPHQLVFDGWSFDILLDELAKIYAALRAGENPKLAPLPFEYRDFAHWQSQRSVADRTLAFHRRTLSAATETGSQRARAGSVQWRFDREALARIEQFTSRNQLRLHEYFLSASVATLSAWRRKARIVVGFQVTGRYNPDVIGQVGCFVSTLPCELTLRGDGFAAQAKHLAEEFKRFLDYQDVTLGELLQGTPHEPQPFPSLVDASLAFQDIRNRPTQLAGLALEQVNLPRRQTEQALEMWVRVEADGLLAVVDYDSAQLGDAELKELGNLFQPYLRGMPEQAPPPVVDVLPTGAPDTSRKPLWRRLFG
jgi:amino acid adenylation domain-containing protein